MHAATGRTWALVAFGLACASIATAQFDPAFNHLSCYPIKGETIRRAVRFDNQFGSEEIASLKPVSLCLPTRKVATPPGNDPLAPTAVPHFKCYRVKVKGKRTRRTVTLVDQFGSEVATATRPNLLCTPVLKDDGAGTTTTTAPITTTSSTPSTTIAATSTTVASTSTSTSSTSTSLVTTTTASTSSTGNVATTTVTTTITGTVTSTNSSSTTTSSSTTSSSTSTTTPSCGPDNSPNPMCTGACPIGFVCLFEPNQPPCQCVSQLLLCGAQSPGQCSAGRCPGTLQQCQSNGQSCACVDAG